MKIIESATFKLTLWYLGILMVLSLLFSFALYRLYDDQAAANIDRQINAVERLPLPLEFQSQRDAYVESLLNELSSEQTRLLYRLVLLNLGTLLVGGGISYMLARQSLKPIQNALEAQGRFTADASHELRTPLTAMKAEIEVALRDKQLSHLNARELLASNLEEVNKLEELAAGLLRLARFDNTLDQASIESVKVADIFNAAVARHQAQIDARALEIKVKVHDETIVGDKASLMELVAILLDNAVKYSPPDSAITLAAGRSHSMVTLSVVDQGIGIKADDIPHIFDRFYRADSSRTKQRVEGYGLGLSIARRIITLHRGEVRVESTVGKGTKFTVRIPERYQPKRDALKPFLSKSL